MTQAKVMLIVVGVILFGFVALAVQELNFQPATKVPLLTVEAKKPTKRLIKRHRIESYTIKPKDRAVEDLWIGMSQASVLRLWGEPYDIDIDIDEDSRDEDWDYSGGGFWSGNWTIFSLYFENGELVRIWEF